MNQRKVDLVQQFFSALQPSFSTPGSDGQMVSRPLPSPPQALTAKEAINMPESFPQFAWNTAGGYGPTVVDGAWHALGSVDYKPLPPRGLVLRVLERIRVLSVPTREEAGFHLLLAAGCLYEGEMDPQILWKMHDKTNAVSPQAFPSLVLVTPATLKPLLIHPLEAFRWSVRCHIAWHLFPSHPDGAREVLHFKIL